MACGMVSSPDLLSGGLFCMVHADFMQSGPLPVCILSPLKRDHASAESKSNGKNVEPRGHFENEIEIIKNQPSCSYICLADAESQSQKCSCEYVSVPLTINLDQNVQV
jgi:hypothetical protein